MVISEFPPRIFRKSKEFRKFQRRKIRKYKKSFRCPSFCQIGVLRNMAIKFYFMAEMYKFRMQNIVCMTEFLMYLSFYDTKIPDGQISKNVSPKNVRWTTKTHLPSCLTRVFNLGWSIDAENHMSNNSHIIIYWDHNNGPIRGYFRSLQH